jgi:probable F420-dependent oxidoreductase
MWVKAGSPKVAICPRATDRSVPLVELARHVEGLGFSGLFVCEHTHVPVDRARSEPPRATHAEWVERLWDPYVALAFVAASTSLEIGTAVSLIAEHDAIVLAKQIASLDLLSGGRLVLGVGWGWLREEFENHGFPASKRVAVLTEKLELMKALWTETEASYDGEYVHLSPSVAWPKPFQRPHPPVLLGVPGNQRNFERIAALADGWIPMSLPMPLQDPCGFVSQLDRFRAVWESAGRDWDLVEVSVCHPAGDGDDLARAMEAATELGIRRIIVQMDVPDDGLLGALDELARGIGAP